MEPFSETARPLSLALNSIACAGRTREHSWPCLLRPTVHFSGNAVLRDYPASAAGAAAANSALAFMELRDVDAGRLKAQWAADWTGKDRLFPMPFSSAYQTQPHYAAVLAISAHKTSVTNGRKLSFQVHLGSGNRILLSTFS